MATAKNKLLTAEDLLRLHSQGVKGGAGRHGASPRRSRGGSR